MANNDSARNTVGLGEIKLRGRVWWVRYYENGRRRQESSGSTTRADAVALLKTRIKELEQDGRTDPEKGKITFSDAAQMVEDDYRINSRRSLDDVKRRITLHLMPFFEGRRLSAVNAPLVQRYIVERLDAKARPATINRELAVLKRCYKLADIVRPAFRMLRENNVRAGFFEPEQLTSVLAHLPESVRPVIQFAAITGWRVQSEVLPLEWRHIDWRAGEVRLDPGTTKNGEGRTFPFTNELRTLLTEQKKVADALKANNVICPWVFHRDGKRIRTFKNVWRTACTDAGCPGRIVHDLRRTAVRHLVRRGIPERVAMQMTGHKTRSVFDRYNIVSDGDLRAAADRLNATGPMPAVGDREG